jgi:hypothetical protein
MSDVNAPTSERPILPPQKEYGPARAERRVERWEAVRRRLEQALDYWLATSRTDGRPHVVPISGAWVDEGLYFNTSPETVSARNLEADGRAIVHLEGTDVAVIVEGDVERPSVDAIPDVVPSAYTTKYGGEWEAGNPHFPWFLLRPAKVLTWRVDDIRNTAVRWRF